MIRDTSSNSTRIPHAASQILKSQFALHQQVLCIERMPKIIFQTSGVELNWDGSEENILEFAEINDLDLDYGCRMGNCTACQQKIVSGEVEYPNGHTGEPEEGYALLCCCAPKGDSDLVIDA